MNSMATITLAVFMNRPDVVEILIQKGADVNDTGEATSNLKSVKNYSPLHAAAETGNLALLTRLINAGADINKVRETSTRNALPMVHGRGASVSYQNVAKETALDLANKGQHEEAINYLLATGAISARSEDKDEPNNSCAIM